MNHELENGNWVDLRYGNREYHRFFGGITEADVYRDGSFCNQLVADIETDLGIKLSVKADTDEPDIQIRWMGTYYDIWVCAAIYDRYMEKMYELLREPELV
jgi:hypothetical protein